MIDFREFEFGNTAFMHFPLLHRAVSSKKGMKKQGRREEFTHAKARTLSTLTELKKKLQKWIWGTVKCVSGWFAVKITKLEKHF
jgi:hypothetical protein